MSANADSAPTLEPTLKPPRIRLLSRPGCHLCDDARAVVEAVCAATGESFEEVDIDAAGDPALLARWSDQVPVTLVDGMVHDYWRVDGDRLAEALRGRR